jgi:hypothetical protein
MSDTSARVSRLVYEHHQAMTAAERWQVAASLFETARAIVESSLPPGLTIEQRRLAVARRFYGTELPEAALLAHAHFKAGSA